MWRVLRLSLLCGLLAASCSAKTDRTKEKNACSNAVRDATISKFSNKCIFKDDHLLASVFARTFNCRAGIGGMWKVDKALFEATKTAASLSNLRTQVEKFIDKKWTDVDYDNDLDYPEYSYLATKMIMEQSSTTIPLSSINQVSYLKNVLKTTEAYTADMLTTEKDELVFKCKSKKVDMVFVLDASGSVGSSSFTKALTFLQNMVDSLTVGEKAARVGMIRYSTTSSVIFKLERYDSKSDIKTAIKNVRYTGGSTYTNLGLDEALKMFNQSEKRQFKTKQLLILLTDGKSTDGAKAVASAQKVKDANIKLIALGISSGIDKTELDNIGSSPKCKNVHFLTSFDDTEDFVTQLKLESCKAPSVVNPGEVIKGELELGETMEVQFQVKDKDIDPVSGTFSIEVTSPIGAVSASVSVDPEPSPALNDCTMSASVDGGGVCYIPMNTAGFEFRRRRRSTSNTRTVYASITGLDHLSNFNLYGSAPRSSQSSLLAVVMCFLVMVTRM